MPFWWPRFTCPGLPVGPISPRRPASLRPPLPLRFPISSASSASPPTPRPQSSPSVRPLPGPSTGPTMSETNPPDCPDVSDDEEVKPPPTRPLDVVTPGSYRPALVSTSARCKTNFWGKHLLSNLYVYPIEMCKGIFLSSVHISTTNALHMHTSAFGCTYLLSYIEIQKSIGNDFHSICTIWESAFHLYLLRLVCGPNLTQRVFINEFDKCFLVQKLESFERQLLICMKGKLHLTSINWIFSHRNELCVLTWQTICRSVCTLLQESSH